jgi:glycosyltransferase involved in cell wall biosynthesis
MEEPLVSVLIPAYNKPQFLEIALNSVLSQTYSNLEIIVCDDSTNDDVKNMIKPYLFENQIIKYHNNGGPLGNYGILNGQKCLSLCSGEFVNYLMDDDVFMPTKIEKMMKYLIDEEVSLVTSHRDRIDQDGNILPEITATKRITMTDRVYQGIELARMMLQRRCNFIGEPTTVIFKKKYIEGYGMFMGRQYLFNVDMAMWLSLLLKGKCVYIAETLSNFRIHYKEQKSFKKELQDLAIKEVDYLVEDGKRAGVL